MTTRRSIPSAVAAGLEQRVGVGAHDVGVERQAQRLGAARHALEVLVHAERPAGVEADDLEDAVAAQQALVGDGDLRLGDVHDDAVEDCEHGGHRTSLRGR